jgi:hypothetical protein
MCIDLTCKKGVGHWSSSELNQQKPDIIQPADLDGSRPWVPPDFDASIFKIARIGPWAFDFDQLWIGTIPTSAESPLEASLNLHFFFGDGEILKLLENYSTNAFWCGKTYIYATAVNRQIPKDSPQSFVLNFLNPSPWWLSLRSDCEWWEWDGMGIIRKFIRWIRWITEDGPPQL